MSSCRGTIEVSILGYPMFSVISLHRPAAIDLLPYPIDASWAPFMPVGFEN
jgi:hypothetical protein